MKYSTLLCLVGVASAIKFAPPSMGPYASDTDHLSNECYGADEDDIMYDVFERYRVEERNPVGAGTGIWKLPKASGPEWAADIVRRFHVMDDSKVDAYVAANFDNFWRKYDNNGTGVIVATASKTIGGAQHIKISQLQKEPEQQGTCLQSGRRQFPHRLYSLAGGHIIQPSCGGCASS